MNEIFIKRLSALMEERELKQAELAKMSGVRASSISDYLTGKYKPKQDNIDLIARALSVSPAWLMGYDDKKESSRISPAAPQDAPAPLSSDRRKIARIPVLGRVASGIPIEAIENIEDYEERYISVLEDPHDYFALRIVGHSMEPRIWDGDVVIAKKTADVDSGSVAVVFVDGEDATVKQIKKSDEGITLIGWNPSVYTPKFYTWAEVEKLPVQILGIVKEVRGKIG